MLYATTGQVNILRVPISSAPESEGVAWAVTLSPRSAYRNHTRTVGTDITDGRVYREFELELARSEAAEDIGGGVAWLVPGWQYDLVLRADGVEYWRDILVVVAASEEPAPVPVAPTPQTSVGCATLAFTVGAAPSGYEVQWSEDGFATVAGTGVAYSRLFGTVGNITISIRHIDVFSNVSEVVQTTATVTMPAAPAAPAAQSRVGCGALTFSVDTPPAGFTAQWSRDNFATIAATGATYDSLYNTIGQTNVAVRYIDACGNSTPTSSTTVTIALPSEPTGGILPPVVPQGVASTLAFSGSIPAGFTLEWSLDNFATVAGTGTSFTSIFLLSSSPYTISLRYVDACGNAGAIAQVPLEVFNFGNALFFDSVNDVWHAVHNAFTDIGGGDFAINVWLKQGTFLTNAPIVHKYDNTTGSLAGWQLVTHIVGANSPPSKILSLQDGKILLGGAFTIYNERTCGRIALLNPDASANNSFNTEIGANNNLLDFDVQGDGKVLIAGSFTTYNSTARNRIARLNADGSLDTTFNDNAGLSFIFADSSNTFSAINIGGPPITSNQWNMLTISRAAGVLSLYVNGGKLRPDVPLVMSMATTQPLLLGGNVSPTPIAVLNGQLNEYTHYNRGLTSAEITEMYKFGLGMKPWGSLLAGLRVRYSFDALASTAYPSPTIADQSGNGNTLTGFNIASNPLVAH